METKKDGGGGIHFVISGIHEIGMQMEIMKENCKNHIDQKGASSTP